MGLAASQARLLLLIARKSDVELNMQNVSQQRINLSSEMSELYNTQAGLSSTSSSSGTGVSEFDSWSDLCDYIDTDDDGILTQKEQMQAKNTFENAGTEQLSIGNTVFDMMYDGNKRKGYKYKGNSGNQIMWGSTGKDKFKGKGGFDIAFNMGGGDKVKQIAKNVSCNATYDRTKTSGTYTSAEGETEATETTNASGISYDSSGMTTEEIDALLSSIQEKDKQLEMINERYETEHEAISTEYDSVEKIIENNIKKSFAAFK